MEVNTPNESIDRCDNTNKRRESPAGTAHEALPASERPLSLQVVHVRPQPEGSHCGPCVKNAIRYRVRQSGAPVATLPGTKPRVRRVTQAHLRRQRSRAKSPTKDGDTLTSDDEACTVASVADSEYGFLAESAKNMYDDFYEDDQVFMAPADGSRRLATEHTDQKIYRAACRQLGVTPSTYFLNHLTSNQMVLKYHALGPRGAKACAIALAANGTIEVLDMRGNELGEEGGLHFAGMLTENTFITELTLSENGLGAAGRLVAQAVTDNDYIRKLDLSGNGFQENDATYFADMIHESVALRELYLGHNAFGERGGELLSAALAHNLSIEVLDLSWNHLRLRGAVAIAKALQGNKGINVLNLSWNGFHLDGCKALSTMLAHNSTLTDLDISSNRVDFECLGKLVVGLRKNHTLTVLRMSNNPISSQGAVLLMDILANPNCTALQELDISGQSVDVTFLKAKNRAQSQRHLVVAHGVLVRQDQMTDGDAEDFFLNDDPMVVLMEFTRLTNLRLVDVFTSMDTDKSWTLSREEFRDGLLKVNIPLSADGLDRLISKLDSDKNGEVDFAELIAGQKEHKKRLHRMMLDARENNVPFEETTVGRVSHKIQALMSVRRAKQLTTEEAKTQQAIQTAVKQGEASRANSRNGRASGRAKKSGRSQSRGRGNRNVKR